MKSDNEKDAEMGNYTKAGTQGQETKWQLGIDLHLSEWTQGTFKSMMFTLVLRSEGVIYAYSDISCVAVSFFLQLGNFNSLFRYAAEMMHLQFL